MERQVQMRLLPQPVVTVRAALIGGAAVTPLLVLFLDRVLPFALAAGFSAMLLTALAAAYLSASERVQRARHRRDEGLRRVRNRAQRLVIYDRETGLYADWYFRLRLEEELQRARRFGEPCTLLLIEAREGRLGRERELRLFHLMTTTFRGTDIVAHLGSLRFAALLSNTTGDGATIARDRLLASSPENELLVGMASFPGEGEDGPSLFAAAASSGAIELSDDGFDEEFEGDEIDSRTVA
jgi:GGDEF domain-containing protein